MLPDDFKMEEYGKPALKIARINGLLNFSFTEKIEEKNKIRKLFFYDTEIEDFIKREEANPKSLKDVKRLAWDVFE